LFGELQAAQYVSRRRKLGLDFPQNIPPNLPIKAA
jgi:hypothetical protein